MAKRYYDTAASPQNLRAIWDQLQGLQEDLAGAQALITAQQTTIDDLNSQVAQANRQAQTALITAGKVTSSTSQVNPPSPSPSPAPSPSGDTHPNHYDLVVQAKADLITDGVSLVGPCGAFEIVKRAAQYIAPSDPAVGLLDKPTGNNCLGYAVDIICYNDGIIYDILIDAGGANTPAWSFSGAVDPSRYRPPL